MSSTSLPIRTRAIILSNGPSSSYIPTLETRPLPALNDGQILVRIGAVAFNHREVWQLTNQYPDTTLGAVMGADGAGRVIASFDTADPLVGKRVFLVPTRGWDKDPNGPESKFGILGGTSFPGFGTFSEYVIVERTEVIECPVHLPLVYAAAWPVAGVTAWRAVKIKANVKPGDNVLITGIGGGVALTALQLCVALGANVYVTSSDPIKIDRAVSLGAVGGVNYKSEAWPKQLANLLKQASKTDDRNELLLDSIIDSAGGDICAKTNKILKPGARVVCFGMGAAPKIDFTMREVLKNIELKGSTMGSRADLVDATVFITKHRIVPEVSHVIEGLDAAHEGFELMKEGKQVGKIVIRLGDRKAGLADDVDSDAKL